MGVGFTGPWVCSVSLGMSMTHDRIEVRGARVHNLRGIDVSLPRDRLIVVTGLSGSGKSSLAFDTIYAEGQRRYVESLSVYARQFLQQVEKPDVELIDGLSPAISIDQKTTGANPRSTVGTVTEVYDYLRLLFAHLGVPHCPHCDRPITHQSVDSIIDMVLLDLADERINVLAPVIRGRKGQFKKNLTALRAKGFMRVRIDGQVHSLDDDLKLERHRNHDVEVLVDRIVIRSGVQRRLRNAIDLALDLAGDTVIINTLSGGDRLFSCKLACAHCGTSMPELTPRVFSFNSPQGACRECQGLGVVDDFDPLKVIPDGSKSLNDGAISSWAVGDKKSVREALNGLSQYFGVDLDTPFELLPAKQRRSLLDGSTLGKKRPFGDGKVRPRGRGRSIEPFGRDFEGILPNLRRRYSSGSWVQQERLEPLRSLQTCPSCQGQRLRPESRSVRFKDRTMADYVELPVGEASSVLAGIVLSEREALIAGRVLSEICDRLRFLDDVGVGYLTLARSTATLSGGEGQRIRLATQIGSGLTGVLYVLDEPSIGLHQRDNQLLLSTLGRLRDLGNTVVVVEHDEETIRSADYVVDLGPGAGAHGGEVLFQGTPAELATAEDASVTGRYLSGKRSIPVPADRRQAVKGELVIRGAQANNLKGVDIAFPLGLLTAVTGVSGSGKSTLVNDILYRTLARDLHQASAPPGRHRCIDGVELVDKVIQIDQSAIGRTPRSNPATYSGLFTPIRELFAMLPEAKARGYKPGRFSFNVKGGRCESCQGAGVNAIEMHFLPDVYVRCEQCKGSRYNRETLEVRYREASIADVLEFTVDQSLTLLENFPSIATKLRTLKEVGLGYLRLGQSATTLSGGEAQRVKLAKELSRRSTGRTVYILDEPTTGLHLEDTRKLLDVLQQLVDQGNTVVVIEHHLDVIKSADYVVDLGPTGGHGGGELVAVGTPEEVAAVEASVTGDCLSTLLRDDENLPN